MIIKFNVVLMLSNLTSTKLFQILRILLVVIAYNVRYRYTRDECPKDIHKFFINFTLFKLDFTLS